MELARDPARRWSLAALARRVASSPFHLSRVFRECMGLPIHRYHRRLRLVHALERMIEGGGGLTDIALDSGFASHSHLTTAFVGEFGVPPSRAVGMRRRVS